MYAAVTVVLAIWALFATERVVHQYDELIAWYESVTKQRQMIRLSESLNRYVREYGAYPASVNALVGTPGYEHVKGYRNSWQGYAFSGTLTDANWQFQRAVLFTFDPTTGSTANAYLAADNSERANGPACGTGGFFAAVHWCGSRESMWYLMETRNDVNDQIVNERARLIRLTQKLANYYNGFGYYPKADGSNTPLAEDSVTSLAELVGYSGGASNCSGQYQFQGVPVDCTDMFNSWGRPVGYQFVNQSHIIIVSETPLVNASGDPVVIAVDRA